MFPYVIDWLFVLVLGVLMAGLSFIIDILIEYIAEAHVVLSLRLLGHTHAIFQYIFWVGYPVLFVLFAVGFVQVVSIHAIGKPARRCASKQVCIDDDDLRNVSLCSWSLTCIY